MPFSCRDAVELRLQPRVVRSIVEVQRIVADRASTNSSSFGSSLSTPPNSTMPSRMSAANSSPSGRRATPTMANFFGSRPACSQVKERRQQLALGQIARRAKDHHDPRIGNPLVRSAERCERSSGRTFICTVAICNLLRSVPFSVRSC